MSTDEPFSSSHARRIEDLLANLDPTAPPWNLDAATLAMRRFLGILGRSCPPIEIIPTPQAFSCVVGGRPSEEVEVDYDLLDLWRRLSWSHLRELDTGGHFDRPYTLFVHAYVHLDCDGEGIAVDTDGWDLYFDRTEVDVLSCVRHLAARYELYHDRDDLPEPDPFPDRLPFVRVADSLRDARQGDLDAVGFAAGEAMVDALAAGVYRWWPVDGRILVLPRPAVDVDLMGLPAGRPGGPSLRWIDGSGTYVVEGTRIPDHLGLALMTDSLTLDDLDRLPCPGRSSDSRGLRELLLPYLPVSTLFRDFTTRLVHRGRHRDELWLVTDVPGRDSFTILLVKEPNGTHGHPRDSLLATIADADEALSEAWGVSVETYRRPGRPAVSPFARPY